MIANMGPLDRGIRLVAGVALIVLGFVLGDFSAPALIWTVGAVGLVLVLTALVSFCPIYRLFGISTCKVSKQ